MNELLTLLFKALSEEFLSSSLYFTAAFALKGRDFHQISETSLELAEDESKDHAEKIMNRIEELGELPAHFSNPDFWTSVSPDFPTLDSFNTRSFLETAIISEEGAIRTYKSIVKLAQQLEDFTTESMAKHILSDEESHLRSLKDYLEALNND